MQESVTGRIFCGSPGQELKRMLKEADIAYRETYVTSVFTARPPDGKLKNFGIKGIANVRTTYAEMLPQLRKDFPTFSWPSRYEWPALSEAHYCTPDLLWNLARLKLEIETVKPNIIIALGATASWALLGETKLARVRGAVCESILVEGVKVIPTYNPAAVLRSWSFRPVVITDCRKALRESAYAEVRRPSRKLWLRPSIADMKRFWEKHLQHSIIMGHDIETKQDKTGYTQTTCMGFASDDSHAIVVPFWQHGNAPNYWRSSKEELEAWNLCKEWLQSGIPIVGQNWMYDLQHLRMNGIDPDVRELHDTMIMHHSMYPEMEKSLAFLGPTYTNEPQWKFMRKAAASAARKDD